MKYLLLENQIPKKIISDEERKSMKFYFLYFSIIIVIIGSTSFFSAFYFKKIILAKTSISYRTIQNYSLLFGFAGVVLYSICAKSFSINLFKTTFYKIQTILLNIPYDPPLKNDSSKYILSSLKKYDSRWTLYRNFKLVDEKYKILNMISGPKGVFILYTTFENPKSKNFIDPAGKLIKLSVKLSKIINSEVLPVIVFTKNSAIYKNKKLLSSKIESLSELFESIPNILSDNEIINLENMICKLGELEYYIV